MLHRSTTGLLSTTIPVFHNLKGLLNFSIPETETSAASVKQQEGISLVTLTKASYWVALTCVSLRAWRWQVEMETVRHWRSREVPGCVFVWLWSAEPPEGGKLQEPLSQAPPLPLKLQKKPNITIKGKFHKTKTGHRSLELTVYKARWTIIFIKTNFNLKWHQVAFFLVLLGIESLS